MQSFLRELKRRNVYRVGAMYAVSGWLLVQVATQVLPVFDVGAGALRAIVLVIIAGFPMALVVSWIYEVTPQGIERTADVPAGQSIARTTGRRLDFVIIGVLALAVVFLLVQRYVLAPRAASAAPDKSIAVLPFANLSEDKSSAFFATGIQDEILTRLAKIGALKVISRTSTQHYAEKPANLPEIARELGVAHVLEGSVQTIGDTVRVNVQLIRAATDDHLWAELYDRKLTDIFAVESEVAGAIADALNAKLTGAEKAAVASRPTQNLRAYDAYLRGLALNTAGYDYTTTRKVAAAYAEAVRLDPDFAIAWATLARAAGYLYFNAVDPDVYTAEYVKHATDQAVRLQPQLAESQFARGNYLYRIERDFAGAERVFRDVTAQAPNDSEAWQFLGLVERRQGKWERALADLQRAVTLDPRNAGMLTTLGGETLLNLHRYAEAHQFLARALVVAPGDELAQFYQVQAFQAEGRLAEAASVVDALPDEGVDPLLVGALAYQRILERKYAAAIAQVEPVLQRGDAALSGQGPTLRLLLGKAQRWSGDEAAATKTLRELADELRPLADKIDDSLPPVTLALALAYAGDVAGAHAQGRHALALFANDANLRPNAEAALAEVLAVAGDRDAAIEQIGKALDMTGAFLTPALLRQDPAWDSLRSDPRFVTLAQREDKPAP
jgi:TolB-like protein/Flp pilus assembly protein TadD